MLSTAYTTEQNLRILQPNPSLKHFIARKLHNESPGVQYKPRIDLREREREHRECQVVQISKPQNSRKCKSSSANSNSMRIKFTFDEPAKRRQRQTHALSHLPNSFQSVQIDPFICDLNRFWIFGKHCQPDTSTKKLKTNMQIFSTHLVPKWKAKRC